MLTVQSVLYILVDVDLVNDLICIVLQGRGKDDDFVEFGHQFDKIYAAGAHQKVAITAVFNVVNQRLIEIEDEGILAFCVAL